ncbi:MAG: hypothetical protein GY809_18775, partial [Planctomycetes bacterium]|nr:hypothetical protein [Planctomycetota bacterium]
MTEQSGQTEFAHTPLQSVEELVEIAGQTPASTVIIPGGSRIEDLQLVEAARDHGILNRALLVGRSTLIQEAVAESGIDIDPSDILHAHTDEDIAKATVARI